MTTNAGLRFIISQMVSKLLLMLLASTESNQIQNLGLPCNIDQFFHPFFIPVMPALACKQNWRRWDNIWSLTNFRFSSWQYWLSSVLNLIIYIITSAMAWSTNSWNIIKIADSSFSVFVLVQLLYHFLFHRKHLSRHRHLASLQQSKYSVIPSFFIQKWKLWCPLFGKLAAYLSYPIVAKLIIPPFSWSKVMVIKHCLMSIDQWREI